MKAVVLAAGRGKRMQTLTNETPKPMLKVAGKTILEHKFDILPEEMTGIVLVIGYLGDVIRGYFGNEYKGRPIEYVYQGELLGTGAALHEAKTLLPGRFIVMMGDDIYVREDIKTALRYPWAILARKMEAPAKGAKVVTDANSHILDIIEGADVGIGEYNNAGLYVMGPEIFSYPLVKLPNGEFGLPQSLVLAAKDFDVKLIEATDILRLTSPEDIERVEKLLKEGVKVS